MFDQKNVEQSRLVDANPFTLIPVLIVVFQQQLKTSPKINTLIQDPSETHAQ
jgi:hypothetical protein